jgi:hypothetical protein
MKHAYFSYVLCAILLQTFATQPIQTIPLVPFVVTTIGQALATVSGFTLLHQAIEAREHAAGFAQVRSWITFGIPYTKYTTMLFEIEPDIPNPILGLIAGIGITLVGYSYLVKNAQGITNKAKATIPSLLMLTALLVGLSDSITLSYC